MKVAIIMPLAEQRGGGEKRLWDLMVEGQGSDLEWLIIFQETGPLVEQIQAIGVEVRVVLSGRLSEPHKLIASILKIAAILREEKVDVVLSWMWKAHFYGGPAALLANVPSIWSQLEIPDDSWLKRLVTALPASGTLINSRSGEAALRRLCPQRSIRVVYPGVALENFNPELLPAPPEVRQKLGLPIDGPLIGIVARLQRWKGIHVLVEAMPMILQHYPSAHCVVVGGTHEFEPDYETYLKSQIQALNLDTKIILTGLQRNIPEWMQAMDVVVHASDREPFGIVIPEAMALGKPIVASNSGGPTEMMIDGVNGLLTPFGDAEALGNAVLRYLNDREFARRIGVAARSRAADFSTQKYARNFMQAIRELTPLSIQANRFENV